MNKTNNWGCYGALGVWILAGLLIWLLTKWTDRTLEFWCSYFSYHPVDIPTWLSFLVTLIGNGFTLLLNAISEIIRLCI